MYFYSVQKNDDWSQPLPSVAHSPDSQCLVCYGVIHITTVINADLGDAVKLNLQLEEDLS